MMNVKTLGAVCALTLALPSTPLAFAGAAQHKSANQPVAQAQTQQMAGYRDWSVKKMTRLQKALVAHGADIQATGHWDDATRAAVKAFQKKQGLDVTGFPNQKTVKLLRQKPGEK
jgi:N-acetyl-anhydromuramyl-L-alanine amidase AmpD